MYGLNDGNPNAAPVTKTITATETMNAGLAAAFDKAWGTDDAYRPDADSLIAAEIARQDRMWGPENERADATKGQMLRAATAQMVFLDGMLDGDDRVVAVQAGRAWYPDDWSGFRDYGSDIANLVVAAAYIRQEIKRKLALGESTERTSRNPDTQAYKPETGLPLVQES